MECSVIKQRLAYLVFFFFFLRLFRYMYTDERERVQLIERVYSSACNECCHDRLEAELCPEVMTNGQIVSMRYRVFNWLSYLCIGKKWIKCKIDINVKGGAHHRNTGSESRVSGRHRRSLERDFGVGSGKRHFPQLRLALVSSGQDVEARRIRTRRQRLGSPGRFEVRDTLSFALLSRFMGINEDVDMWN